PLRARARARSPDRRASCAPQASGLSPRPPRDHPYGGSMVALTASGPAAEMPRERAIHDRVGTIRDEMSHPAAGPFDPSVHCSLRYRTRLRRIDVPDKTKPEKIVVGTIGWNNGSQSF